MTPSGRVPADVIAGLDPKSAATVYGRRIPSTSELPAAVVSPIQPQNSGALVAVAVSVVVRFSGINTPAVRSTPAVSAWTVPPPPTVALSRKSRTTFAVSVPPARVPVIGWLIAPPSDQDTKCQRVRPFAATWPSVNPTV